MEVKTLKEVLELNLMQDVRCLKLIESTLKGYSKGSYNGDWERVFNILLDKEEELPTCLDYNHVEALEINSLFFEVFPNNMPNLKVLEIIRCKNIKELPESYKRLEKLTIAFSDNIKYLPDGYHSLKKLEIYGAEGIKELPKYKELEFFYCCEKDLIEQAELLPNIKIINDDWYSGN